MTLPHTAKLTQTWIRSKRVSILKLPTASPVLSFIENIFNILKRNVDSVPSPHYITNKRLSEVRMEKNSYKHIKPFSIIYA